jgi:hypothetical protein
MPASLPGATKTQNLANPTQGQFVILDPLSGPKGSPLDAKKPVYAGPPGPYVADITNLSTGGLSTGIGIGANHNIGLTPELPVLNAIGYSIFKAGFDDDMQPGTEQAYNPPPPPGNVASNTVDSTRMYIGGGRDIVNTGTLPGDRGRKFIPSPYTAGVVIAGAGNGGSRDGGAGPAFTGFSMKMVSNTGTAVILNGAAVEGTFNNRSGATLAISQSTFGSNTAAISAPA